VRQQREERERAKADAEEALTLLNRERAVAEAMEAEAKEDEFHLEQLQVGCWCTCPLEGCRLVGWAMCHPSGQVLGDPHSPPEAAAEVAVEELLDGGCVLPGYGAEATPDTCSCRCTCCGFIAHCPGCCITSH
jgi:hypothetical protein